MNKTYLRYVHDRSFGVIASTRSNAIFADGDGVALSGALQNVGVWHLRRGTLVKLLTPDDGGDTDAEVSHLHLLPGGTRVCAGYTSGVVRVYDFGPDEAPQLALNGHKADVSALCSTGDGVLLASGSKDTGIVVWDLLAEAGKCRLRGHRAAVTGAAFLPRGAAFLGLVSSSCDALVKVWDVEAQHCLQTLVGHRSEVWSLALSPDGLRLASGSEDSRLRVWRVGDDPEAPAAAIGSVERAVSDRLSQLQYHPTGRFLGAATPGKALELYLVRGSEEAAKKMKRRLRRRRSKRKEGEGGESEEEESPLPTAQDELQFHLLLRSSHRIKSFSFPKALTADGGTKVLLSLANNSLELHAAPAAAGADASRLMVLDMHGHRSDVRSLSLSRDARLICSASARSLKVWNASSAQCVRSCAVGGLGLCVAFAPGDRHVLLGTREGLLLVVDVASGETISEIRAHGGAIWALDVKPDNSGIATASADKSVKFWDFELAGGGALGLVHARTLQMSEDALCVRYSRHAERAKRLVAVSVLDCTVKVFFEDSLRFFLSLYGHKLPVLDMAISDDGELLASGSADKTIKFWGLDFGDCHRSLLAHDDSVMAVAFVRGTHYLFSASKDRTIKYWDGDAHEQILCLRGHAAEVWGLSVAQDGASFVSGGHDRSIRVWKRTEEMVFLDEERERALDAVFEAELDDDRRPEGEEDRDADAPAEEAPGRRSLEAVASAERLLEACEVASAEVRRFREHEEACEKAREEKKALPPAPQPNILLLGSEPRHHVLRMLRMVKAPQVEQALLVATFAQARMLLEFLADLLEDGASLELLARCAIMVTRAHAKQIAATPAMLPVLLRLQRVLRPRLRERRDLIGVNVAAMQQVRARLEDGSGKAFAADREEAAKRQRLL